jgi:hypothetical protein
MVITIKETTDSTSDYHIQKLEHKILWLYYLILPDWDLWEQSAKYYYVTKILRQTKSHYYHNWYMMTFPEFLLVQ